MWRVRFVDLRTASELVSNMPQTEDEALAYAVWLLREGCRVISITKPDGTALPFAALIPFPRG